MADLERTRVHLEKGLTDHLWTGYSLAVCRAGLLHAIAGGDVPDSESPVRWFSAGKPVTAAGVLRVAEIFPELWERPLAHTLEELEGSYAGALTLRDLLTHQTGLRIAETSLRGDSGEIWDFFRRITPADCKLVSGQAAYDPAGGWWLLGQWIERVMKKPWAAFLEQDLLQPAELSRLRFHAPAVPIMERRAGQWIPGESGHGPGAGLNGPASEMALFYEKLVRGQILRPASLKKMTGPSRIGQLDATFGHIVDFGLGVILNSNRYGATTVPYGFGIHAGAGAFGHGGARSSVAFADPDAGFSAAIFLNGRVPETEHQPRMRGLLDLLRSELV